MPWEYPSVEERRDDNAELHKRIAELEAENAALRDKLDATLTVIAKLST